MGPSVTSNGVPEGLNSSRKVAFHQSEFNSSTHITFAGSPSRFPAFSMILTTNRLKMTQEAHQIAAEHKKWNYSGVLCLNFVANIV
jgi:hypothetical protein